MSVQVRQAVAKRFTGDTTWLLDWNEDTLAGSYLISVPCFSGAASTTISVDDAVFSFVNQNTIAGATGLTARYYRITNAGIQVAGTNHPSITFSGATEGVWFLLELTGAPTSNATDVTVFTSQGTSTSPVSGSITTTLVNDVVLGFLFNRNTDAQTPSGSSIALSGISGDGNQIVGVDSTGVGGGVYVISGGTIQTGTYQLAATIGNSRTWVGVGVAVKDILGAGVLLGQAQRNLHVQPAVRALAVSGQNSQAFKPNTKAWRWPEALSGTKADRPDITMLPASSIATTAAILNASVDAQGLDTTIVFSYGSGVDTNGDPVFSNTTPPVTLAASFGATTVSTPITGLTPGLTYAAEAVATNTNGATTSSFIVFTTPSSGGPPPSGPPIVTTAPTLVGVANQTSLTVTTVFDMNGAAGTVHLELLVGATWTEVGTPLATGPTVATQTQTATGLTPGTTYQFRGRATNPNAPEPGGTISSASQITTQQTTQLPIVSLLPTQSITTTSAVISGRVDNIVQVPVTNQFEYGLTTAYGTPGIVAHDTQLPPGGTENWVQTVSGLTPNTTYHFRLNSIRNDGLGGTQHSADGTFTTLASGITPLPIPLLSLPTNITTTGATLNGTLTMEPT